LRFPPPPHPSSLPRVNSYDYNVLGREFYPPPPPPRQPPPRTRPNYQPRRSATSIPNSANAGATARPPTSFSHLNATPLLHLFLALGHRRSSVLLLHLLLPPLLRHLPLLLLPLPPLLLPFHHPQQLLWVKVKQ